MTRGRRFDDPSPAFLSAVLSDLEALHDEAPPAAAGKALTPEAQAYLDRVQATIQQLGPGEP